MKIVLGVLIILFVWACKEKNPELIEYPTGTATLNLTVMRYEDYSNRNLKPFSELPIYVYDITPDGKKTKDDITPLGYNTNTKRMRVHSHKELDYIRNSQTDKDGKTSISVPYGKYMVYFTRGNTFSYIELKITKPVLDTTVERAFF